MALYAKHENELSPKDRDRLLAAMSELRAAVADYDKFVVTEPLDVKDVEPIPMAELARAQQRVTDAEGELWRLREELMGWARPTTLPGPALVADWFSKEDEVYDKMGEVPPTRS